MHYGLWLYEVTDGIRPLTDVQPSPHIDRKSEGETVEIIGDIPFGPLTYDPETKSAIAWQAEIDRRCATELAITQEQNCFRIECAASLHWLTSNIGAMQTIEGQSFSNNAQRDQAIKTIASAMRECNLILRRMLSLEARRTGGIEGAKDP